MDKNIAIVGCGYWGRNLVRNFADIGALHTICDSSPGALSQFETVYPTVYWETSYDSVLANEEIKGIIISSPAALHHSMAMKVLLAGKDVFIEKPLSLKVEDGEELVRLAEENGSILMVGHVLEYHPGIAKLRQLVEGRELGQTKFIHY